MDSFIALIIFFFLLRWILGRAKQAATTASGSGAKRSEAKRDEGRQISFDTYGSLLQSGEQKKTAKYREAPLQEGMPMYDYVSAAQEGEGPLYGGSLGYSSLEGVDICNPSLNHDRIISEEGSQPPEEPKEVAGLSLSFTKDAIVQGIVMSEILTRPSERKWGRR